MIKLHLPVTILPVTILPVTILPAAILAVLIAAGPAAVTAAPGSQDQGIVAGLISSLLSSRTSKVSIGAVDGVLSSDTTVHDITISDSQGQWFHLDRVRLVWNRGALFSRRLEIDTLDIGKTEIARPPVAADPVAADPAAADPAAIGLAATQPMLPELPLKLVVRAFSLAELDLGQAVVGAAARLTASGSAALGKPAEGLHLAFESRRLDAAGHAAMRLSFVPESEALELSASLDEPAGGLLAKAARLPDEPALRFNLTGSGTLNAFTARLSLDGEPVLGATGTADLHRIDLQGAGPHGEDAGRRLLLALDTHLSGVLPPPLAALFPGATQLKGDLRFGDQGTLDLSDLTLTAPGGRLEAVGHLDAQNQVDLHVTAESLPPPSPTGPPATGSYGRLAFDGTVSGPLTGPRLRATLEVAEARLPQGRCDTLAFSVSATPDGDLANPATRIAVAADGRATGVAPADPALARALGDRLALTLKGTLSPDGNGDYEVMRANGSAADFRYRGQLGPSRLKGQVTADVPDLSRFAALTGQPLQGAVSGTLALDGVPGNGIGDATVTAHATNLVTGLAALDGILGNDVTASGTARLLPDHGFGFQALMIKGRYGTASLDGTASADRAGVTARLIVPDLARADRRLSGSGEAVAALTGSLRHPDLSTHVALANGRMLGRPVPRLGLEAEVHDLTGALDARVALTGEVDRKPATGSLRLLRRPDGTLVMERLDAAIGSVTIKGAVTVAPDRQATGALAVTARTLDDLSPLLLTRLAGSLAADLKLAVNDGRQVVRVHGNGSGLRAPGLAIARFDGQGEVTDPLGRPAVTAGVTAEGIAAAGTVVSNLHMTAAGTGDATDLTASARIQEVDVEARGRLLTGAAPRLELTAASARRADHRVVLAGPASLTLTDGTLDIRGLAVLIDGGRIGIQGQAGRRLELAVNASGVPLSAAGLVVPDLGLSGILDGEATVGGSEAAPEGRYRLTLKQVTAAQLRTAGAPPLDISAAGTLRGQTAGVDATVAAGGDTSIHAHGTVPLTAQGALDLTVRGKLDAGLANAVLAAGGRRLTGTVAVDLRASGPVTQPALSGTAALAAGSYRDTLKGVSLGALQARLTARGADLTLDEASASTGNGGTLSARGNVRLNLEAGFPGALHLEGRRAELIADGTTTAVADLDLDVTGPLMREPRLSGQIRTVSVDVRIPERLPATLKPLDDTRHLHAIGAAASRLAEIRRETDESEARRRRAAVLKVTLDITVSSPGRVFVRGRGLDAELGGDLAITGTSDAPRVVGAYSSRQGHLDALGTRLDFSRGRLAFSGDLMPQLDFLAESTAKDITVQIAVTGPASRPVFAFTSQPALPEDEVLSRLLFSKASGTLSPFQALRLAQVLSQFSNGGDDAFDRLRRSLGVDSLDLQTGTGGASLSLSRAIGDRVTVGVKGGSTAEQSGLSANIDLTHRLRLKNEIDSRGSTSMGLGAEWEY